MAGSFVVSWYKLKISTDKKDQFVANFFGVILYYKEFLDQNVKQASTKVFVAFSRI